MSVDLCTTNVELNINIPYKTADKLATKGFQFTDIRDSFIGCYRIIGLCLDIRNVHNLILTSDSTQLFFSHFTHFQ